MLKNPENIDQGSAGKYLKTFKVLRHLKGTTEILQTFNFYNKLLIFVVLHKQLLRISTTETMEERIINYFKLEKRRYLPYL